MAHGTWHMVVVVVVVAAHPAGRICFAGLSSCQGSWSASAERWMLMEPGGQQESGVQGLGPPEQCLTGSGWTSPTLAGGGEGEIAAQVCLVQWPLSPWDEPDCLTASLPEEPELGRWGVRCVQVVAEGRPAPPQIGDSRSCLFGVHLRAFPF